MNLQQEIAHLSSAALSTLDLNIGSISPLVSEEDFNRIITSPELDANFGDDSAEAELSRLVSLRETIILWSELAAAEPQLCVADAIDANDEFVAIYKALSEEFLPSCLH